MVEKTLSPLLVAPEEAGMRIDRWLKAHLPNLSHGQLEKLLRTGQIRLDGGRAKASDRVETGQAVRLPPDHVLERLQGNLSPTPRTAKPAHIINLRPFVIHQDDLMIVINKPSGLATQGGSGLTTSVDQSLDSLITDGEPRPKLVHRLDKDTSGVLVLARTAQAARLLTKWFQDRQMQKVYWGVVYPIPQRQEGEIVTGLSKNGPEGREKVSVDNVDGLMAETSYRTLGRDRQRDIAWLELTPHTGRTHQLRVHCAHIGSPIVGDGKYGGTDAFPFGRPCTLHLHAQRLYFPEYDHLILEAPLPPHMEETFQACGWGHR